MNTSVISVAAVLVAVVSAGLSAGLSASGPGSPPGYSRAQFGSGYTDTDHDGCDTREELLSAPGPCPPRAVAVTITDPYTGQVVTGRDQIEVEHIVSLRWVWDHGAVGWSRAKRVAFANDPDNVVLASARVNQSKGARGPSRWLPPDPARRCWFAQRWTAVVSEYGVVLVDGDPDAVVLRGILATCR